MLEAHGNDAARQHVLVSGGEIKRAAIALGGCAGIAAAVVRQRDVS